MGCFERNLKLLDQTDDSIGVYTSSTIHILSLEHCNEMMEWLNGQQFVKINKSLGHPNFNTHHVYNPKFLSVGILDEDQFNRFNCSSFTKSFYEKTKMSDAEKPETQERREQKVEHAFLQQQHKEVSELCQSEGFNYQQKNIAEISKFGIEIIKKSIQLYKLRSLTKYIKNKEGFLIDCLKGGWWRNLPEPEEEKGIWDRAVDDFRVKARQLIVKFGNLPNLDYDLKPYPAVDWGSSQVLTPT